MGRSISSSETPLTQDPRYEVDLFWNLEDATVTKDEANEIARRITNSLKTINNEYHLGKMYAVGSCTLDSIKEVSEVLERNGFEMKDSPVKMKTCHSSGCDKVVRVGTADRVILQSMTRHFLEVKNKNKNVMVISCNPDFKLTMDMLKKHGFKTFVAAKWSDSTSEYQLSGDHVFEWEEIKVGTAHEIPKTQLLA